MVRVKICGITDLRTALGAAEAGADALGFVFAPSRRKVLPEVARDIIRALPPFVARVGVFVDQPLEEVREIAAYCALEFVQLHGRESPDYCRRVGRPVIKAFRVRDRASLSRVEDYPDVAAILLDTYTPAALGGAGVTFDWEIVGGISFPRPVILAGGLHPANVAQAIARVQPYGVDVSSGVETGGRKDLAKIRAFIRQAKGGVV